MAPQASPCRYSKIVNGTAYIKFFVTRHLKFIELLLSHFIILEFDMEMFNFLLEAAYKT